MAGEKYRAIRAAQMSDPTFRAMVKEAREQMAVDDPLPPNFVGFPLPGFCIDCGTIVARTYAGHNGLRLCRLHLRQRMRKALWPDIPPHLREPTDR